MINCFWRSGKATLSLGLKRVNSGDSNAATSISSERWINTVPSGLHHGRTEFSTLHTPIQLGKQKSLTSPISCILPSLPIQPLIINLSYLSFCFPPQSYHRRLSRLFSVFRSPISQFPIVTPPSSDIAAVCLTASLDIPGGC